MTAASRSEDLLGKAKRGKVIGPGPDCVLVAHFEDQARVAAGLAQRPENCVQGKVAFARIPVGVTTRSGLVCPGCENKSRTHIGLWSEAAYLSAFSAL